MLKRMGVMISCPNCKSRSEVRVDEYKYNVEWDRTQLSANSIFLCDSCGLMFADPMPSVETLTSYYKNWYRAKGRPHYSGTALEPTHRHLAYLAYLTHAVDMRGITDVFEIGAGWGEIGVLLKARHPHLKITTSEPDKFVRDCLTSRGYSVVEAPSTDCKFDLVLGFHTLEHFTNPGDFFALTSNLRPHGFLMLEVPNCDIDAGWLQRAYDSPHLLFFTRSSVLDAAKSQGFEAVSCHVAGTSIQTITQLEAASKAIHGAWTPSKPRKHLSPLARILSGTARVAPTWLKKLGQRIMVTSDISQQIRISSAEFDNSNDSGWVIRGVFQKSN